VANKLRKQLGEFLRQERGNLTLAQFAKKLGVSDSSLQRLEIGEQNITIDTLERLLGKLDAPMEKVFRKPTKFS